MRSADLSGWPWLGVPLGIDLANTVVTVRPGKVHDLLETEEQLDDWLSHERGRLPRPPRGPERLPAFRRLRDGLHSALAAAAEGKPPPQAATRTINAASARCSGPPVLRVRAGRARVDIEGAGSALDRSLALIARSAIDVLGGLEVQRLKVCAAPSCGLFYFARPGQQWCSTACGNRMRAARHYRRSRARNGSASRPGEPASDRG